MQNAASLRRRLLPPLQAPHRRLAAVGIVLGLFALLTPFLPGTLDTLVLGLLVAGYGVLQNVAGFSQRARAPASSWFSRGGASILTGLLLVAMPSLTFSGLALLLGMSWIISGGSAAVAALARRGQPEWHWELIDALVSLALGLAIGLQWPISGVVSVGLFVGLRFLSDGWSHLVGRGGPHGESAPDDPQSHPDPGLGLPPHPLLGQLRRQLTDEALVRRRSDRGWCWLFLLTFFAIHAARMHAEWDFVGLLSPAGAVLGDVLLALVIAYGLAAPVSLAWRRLTRRLERRAWSWLLQRADQEQAAGVRAAAVRRWLARRMRAAVHREQARGSATAALGWGLRTGLPPVALLMALTPLWGVSWFFDTETWVTGAWELWANERTDTWRASMVDAVRRGYGPAAEDPDFFRVAPEGLPDSGDFSFIVIGDTGEGDASQHILRDQLLQVGRKPEVKFLVLSSDVIYPAGAMQDYEPRFYLPFKGFERPIYAIPGNHDWYDALESFAANFFEPAAARAALRARREVDLNLTATTEARIDHLVAEARRLRGEYQLRTARQRATYFELRTSRFCLVAADTGILRRLDDEQLQWLDQALHRGGDRFKLVILGHPLYAAGHYQAADRGDFARVHDLLRRHRVDVVLAGDTHDFEYYREPLPSAGQGRSMYHFVNGGGGAYLSIGTSLEWPGVPPVAECGCYPRADALTAAIEARTPPWKRPLWLWVKHLGAWPASPELVASAFNYDRAPFFQSFLEVRVEPSAGLVRLWLYGANGRLRWRELQVHEGRIPFGHSPDQLVEFAFPLPGPAAAAP